MLDRDLDRKIDQAVKAPGDRLAARIALASLGFLRAVGRDCRKPLDALEPEDLLDWFNRPQG